MTASLLPGATMGAAAESRPPTKDVDRSAAGAAAVSPTCWDCGYSLRGLTPAILRCPDCGRAFDPGDPRSVNRGKRVGRVARRLLVPPGRLTNGMVLVAVALVVWGTGGVTAFKPKFDDWPLLTRSCRDADPWRFYTGHWRAYVIGVALLALAGLPLVLRMTLRAALIWRHRPPPDLRGGRARAGVAAVALLAVALAFVGCGGAMRIGREWTDSLPRMSRFGTFRSAAAEDASQFLRPDRTEAVIRALLLAGDAPRQRRTGLSLRTTYAHERERLPLREAVRGEPDTDLLATELRVLGMYREPLDLDLVASRLDDPRPVIRAAAADAIGLIHSPAFRPKPRGISGETDASIPGDPPIALGRFVDKLYLPPYGPPSKSNDVPPFDKPSFILPTSFRDRLTRMMLDGPTLEEREAAERALLLQPPEGYRLRYAEWGVWLNDDADGHLKMARAIEEEIPPFVHRTGNSLDSMGPYVQQIMQVTKPVVHLTVSQPMPVDVEVLIRLGRPLFAYPMPDDFEVIAESRQGRYRVVPPARQSPPASLPTSGPIAIERYAPPLLLAPLDPPEGFPTLPAQALRSGYPWMAPPHRKSGPSGGVGSPFNDISAWGVHWQSAIVTPIKLGWMKEPAVGDDPKHAWWRRLREVDCSWVANRGESERFLYYDGATLMKMPFETYVKDGLVHSRRRAVTKEDEALGPPLSEVDGGITSVGSKRAPFYRWRAVAIRVGASPAQPIASASPGESEDHLAVLGPAAAEAAFGGALLDAGLAESEAGGLLDTWRESFFRKPGLRVLMVMPRSAYDEFCPLTVRPAPTETVRVGIVVTELAGRGN